MILIHAAGRERMFSMCTRNHKPPPAMGRIMRTGSSNHAASAKRARIAKQAVRGMRTSLAKRIGVRSAARRGFTLLELMIVITIITILVGMAAGAYVKSVQRAKEATLKSDLAVI